MGSSESHYFPLCFYKAGILTPLALTDSSKGTGLELP